jgi:four helix bundle protein
MQDHKKDLRDRTKQYALRIIRLYSALPQTKPAQVIGRQLLRSGTSVGANYRETCRARSNSEFISKTGIVIQELDETAYWLELLFDATIDRTMNMTLLMAETDELISIFTSIVKKVKNG